MSNNIGIVLYGVRRGGLRFSWAPRSAAHLCFVYYTICKMSYYTIIIIAVVIIPLLGGQYKGYRFINRETPYSSWQRSRAGIRSFPTRTRWPQTFRTTSITTRVTTILYNLNYSYTHDTAINCPVIISVHKLPGEFTHRR